jgi:hypothetical protein
MTIDEKLNYLRELLIEVQFKEGENKSDLFNSVRLVYRYPSEFFNLPNKAIDNCVDQLKLDIFSINKARAKLPPIKTK